MLPIKKAVKECGGQSQLAALIGVTQSAISHFSREGKQVPARLCAAIEEATNCVVTREELRPDIFTPRVKKIEPMEFVTVTLSELNIKELRLKYPLLEPDAAFKKLIADRKEMRIEINVNG